MVKPAGPYSNILCVDVPCQVSVAEFVDTLVALNIVGAGQVLVPSKDTSSIQIAVAKLKKGLLAIALIA